MFGNYRPRSENITSKYKMHNSRTDAHYIEKVTDLANWDSVCFCVPNWYFCICFCYIILYWLRFLDKRILNTAFCLYENDIFWCGLFLWVSLVQMALVQLLSINLSALYCCVDWELSVNDCCLSSVTSSIMQCYWTINKQIDTLPVGNRRHSWFLLSVMN